MYLQIGISIEPWYSRRYCRTVSLSGSSSGCLLCTFIYFMYMYLLSFLCIRIQCKTVSVIYRNLDVPVVLMMKKVFTPSLDPNYAKCPVFFVLMAYWLNIKIFRKNSTTLSNYFITCVITNFIYEPCYLIYGVLMLMLKWPRFLLKTTSV